jgi:hypothetical protein
MLRKLREQDKDKRKIKLGGPIKQPRKKIEISGSSSE